MKFNSLIKSVPSAVACAVASAIIAASLLVAPSWAQDQPSAQAPPPPSQAKPPTAPLTPEQLRELVAPIALYPDALVAQILAASAYPTQIVEAERFLQQNPNLKDKELGDAVNQQDWDPSVKALTPFPSVLANLDSYDPEVIYGYPVGLWPGFYPWWGVGGPYLSFGVGFGIGPFFGFGWGWPAWGFNWGGGFLRYGGGRYGFHSQAFYNRNAYIHGNYRGFAPYARGDRGARGFAGPGARGYAGAGARGSAGASRGFTGAGGRAYAGTRSGALSGYSHGGYARGYSERGRSSFGGGGGGGGSRGGGGHGGGRR
jgi:hypothetical protein